MRAEQLLTEGRSSSDVARALAAQFGTSERSGWSYVAAARENFASASAEERPHQKGQLRAFLRRCAQEALADGQYTAAIGAAKELARLDGLAEPTRLDVNATATVTGQLEAVQTLTSTERRRRLAELEAKRGAGEIAAARERLARELADTPAKERKRRLAAFDRKARALVAEQRSLDARRVALLRPNSPPNTPTGESP